MIFLSKVTRSVNTFIQEWLHEEKNPALKRDGALLILLKGIIYAEIKIIQGVFSLEKSGSKC